MTKQSRTGIILVSLGASLVVHGCAMATHQVTATQEAAELQNRVLINNRAVEVISQQNVIELLAGRIGRFRLQNAKLLVVVDDVPLNDGLTVLYRMSPREVQNITTLWGQDASFRYGPGGSDGAIVVTTKRGYRMGHAN